MFLKWILFLSAFTVLDAQYFPNRACTTPRLAHGKVRGRSTRKLIKFTCFSGYELVGNKYATCKDGEWDTPKPICIKPGCPVPEIENGLRMTSRDDAWVVFFCLPGHSLLGSTAIYCDGRTWNTTAPICVDEKQAPKTSCDFEDPHLCGWTQDNLHDFDWERHNRKTPSSFLNTGPSHDHTYGEGQSGHYMYIESSSRLQNDTARLISPIYDVAESRDACFTFFYHMYGKETGGLRVYQKPDSLPLHSLLELPDYLKKKYMIFEMWGNQGDVWWGEISRLTDFGEDFQMVVEGIRGKKFTSDIAIDDVSILHGENCTVMQREMVTPSAIGSETCENRCNKPTVNANDCGCTWSCIIESNCCRDYIESCYYIDSTTEDQTTEVMPQTQKLIAKSPTTTEAVTTTTTTTTKLTTSTTRKPSSPNVTVSVIWPKPTSPPRVTMTPMVTMKDAISENKTETTKVAETTTVTVPTKPTTVKTTTMEVTTIKKIDLTTVKPVTVPVKSSTKAAPTRAAKAKGLDSEKKKEEARIQTKHVMYTADNIRGKSKSSAWRPVLITLAILLCGVGAAWLVKGARGARGRAALATLRGRVTHDSEVLYLPTDTDD